MNKLTRRLTIATSAAAVAGALTVSFALAQAQVDVIIPVQPPAPRVEVVPTVPAGRVYQPGYWVYEKDKYNWREGRIVEPPRPRAVWVPGRYEPRGSGWVFIEGHWN